LLAFTAGIISKKQGLISVKLVITSNLLSCSYLSMFIDSLMCAERFLTLWLLKECAKKS